ncbi:hypothetical protein ACWFRT_10150 [Streptomyces anulatus]
MDTVHTTAALLPEPAELRVFLRALAVLDQAICRDPRFSRYSFSTTWGPGTEAALMDTASDSPSLARRARELGGLRR